MFNKIIIDQALYQLNAGRTWEQLYRSKMEQDSRFINVSFDFFRKRPIWSVNHESMSFLIQSMIIALVNALSGKFPKNFQKGEVTDFGDYKGCLLSSSLKKSSTQYCTVSMVPNFEKLNELNISSSDTDRIFGNDYDIPVGRFVEIGICTIASCSSLDVNIIYQQGELDQP